jgi:hypothetical protein
VDCWLVCWVCCGAGRAGVEVVAGAVDVIQR